MNIREHVILLSIEQSPKGEDRRELVGPALISNES